MARPLKTGLEYFPLDVKFDDEVNLIIADFGVEGLGVLISMFQNIYRNKGYYSKWTLREQKLFSRMVGLDFELSTKIISECIEWGIFDKGMYEKHEILTSRRIQEHYATSTYKRSGVTMVSEFLVIDLSSKKHITVLVSDDGNEETTDVSDDKSTQSKVQYSKVQYSKKEEHQKSDDEDEEKRKKVIQNYSSKFGTNLVMLDMVSQAIDEFGSDWMLEALDIAVKNGAKNYRYCETILNDWKTNGKKEVTQKNGQRKQSDEERYANGNNTEFKSL